MRRAEVNIIIEDGTTLAGIVQECIYLWADDGIQGEITAEKYDIIGIDIRINIFDAVVGMILVEDILRIIPFIQEGKGDRGL